MIIKNNFNEKDINPLNDYNEIGKGSHSLEKELEREKQGFIKANLENKVLEDLQDDVKEEEEPEEDNWKFFR